LLLNTALFPVALAFTLDMIANRLEVLDHILTVLFVADLEK
jgi:hypothetical protein